MPWWGIILLIVAVGFGVWAFFGRKPKGAAVAERKLNELYDEDKKRRERERIADHARWTERLRREKSNNTH